MESSEIKDHKKLKASVVGLLRDAKAAMEAHFGEEKKDQAKAFEDLIEKTEKGRFSIIVVGEFSAGKSTMLNALMGEKFLPSFSKPTTANINILRSVNDSPTGKPMLRITYKDGNIKTSFDMSAESIEQFVSTNGDNVTATIEYVEIFLDSPFLNSGIDLIDSPGLNDTNVAREEVTRGQMKASHASIFLFRGDQPGTKSDFETLKNLKKTCKSIILVLNKIDEIGKLGEKETPETVIEGIQKSYKNIFPNDRKPAEIWPISAYAALIARSNIKVEQIDGFKLTEEQQLEYKAQKLKFSRIEAFESRLMRYITQGEKAKNELLSPVEKVLSVTSEAEKDLETERETLDGKYSTEEINDQLEALGEEKKELDKVVQKKKRDVSVAVSDIIKQTQDSIKSDTKDIKEKYMHKMENESEIADLSENAEAIVERIKNEYTNAYNEAVAEIEWKYKEAIRRNSEGAADIINKRLRAARESEDDEDVLGESMQIDKGKFSVDFDLSKYDNLLEEKLSAVREATVKENEAMNTKEQISQLQLKVERVEERQKRSEDSRERRIAALGDRPEQLRYTTREKQWVTKDRNPFSFARLFGSTTYEAEEYRDVVKFDDSMGQRYDEEKKQIEAQYAEQQEKLEQERQEIEEKMDNLCMGASDAAKYKRERERLEEEIKEVKKEKEAKLRKQLESKLKGAKEYMMSVFESLETNSRKKILKAIEGKGVALETMAMEIIESEIKKELEEKERKMKSLKEKLTKSENDKKERMEKIAEALEEIVRLKEKAKGVKEEIEGIKTDVIEEK